MLSPLIKNYSRALQIHSILQCKSLLNDWVEWCCDVFLTCPFYQYCSLKYERNTYEIYIKKETVWWIKTKKQYMLKKLLETILETIQIFVIYAYVSRVGQLCHNQPTEIQAADGFMHGCDMSLGHLHHAHVFCPHLNNRQYKNMCCCLTLYWKKYLIEAIFEFDMILIRCHNVKKHQVKGLMCSICGISCLIWQKRIYNSQLYVFLLVYNHLKKSLTPCVFMNLEWAI